MDELSSCPCDSGRDYDGCCGRYIDGGDSALTAEVLMRSRYCAYVRRDSAYVLRTWHESTRPNGLDLDGDQGLKWLGLKVLNTEAGAAADRHGRVEFVARYKRDGKAVRLHERSRFERRQGQWFYVDGEQG